MCVSSPVPAFILQALARLPTTGSSVHTLTHSLAHPPAPPFTHSLTRSPTCSSIHSLTRSPTHSSVHALPRSLVHSLTHLLLHARVHSLTRSFILSFLCSLVHRRTSLSTRLFPHSRIPALSTGQTTAGGGGEHAGPTGTPGVTSVNHRAGGSIWGETPRMGSHLG